MQLSDDDSSENDAELLADSSEHAAKKRRGEGKVATARARGGARTKPFKQPLPYDWRITTNNHFQQYKAPDDTRVWNRRINMVIDDAYTLGVPRHDKPGAPVLFEDNHLFDNPSSMLHSRKLLWAKFTSRDRLQRRIEVRIVRMTLDHFVNNPLHEAPTKLAVDRVNHNISRIFGEQAPPWTPWTQKAVIAHAWPAVALTGDALAHYKGGPLAQQQRDSRRLLDAATLRADDAMDTTFKDITGQNSMFVQLTGCLREAAILLATIIRDGLLVEKEGGFVPLTGYEKLFSPILTTHGKPGNAPEVHAAGDSLTITIFSVGEQRQSRMIEYKGKQVELDAMASFLYELNESTLNQALKEIEKALPERTKFHTAAVGQATRKKPGPSFRLAAAGRGCVEKLKELLPCAGVPALKKMHKKAGFGVTQPNDVNTLVKEIVGHLLPGYPFVDPHASVGGEPNGKAQSEQTE